MNKIDLTKVEAIDVTKTETIVTPMPEPVVIPKGLHSQLGDPEAIWIYRMADGSAFGAVARWNPEGQRKQIRPIVWNGKEHVTSGFGDNRPLYNTDILAASPIAPVLIVEGEKAAIAAQGYVPEGWVVTTWQGGANAVEKADWAALADHKCVIWPDNDSPGMMAGDLIRKILSSKSVASSLISVPPSFPDGWDLADDLPPKVTKTMITQLLKRGLRDADIIQELVKLEPEGKSKIDIEGNDPDVVMNRKWRPIGYDNQVYYYMNEKAQQVYKASAKTLMSETGIKEVVSSEDYWREVMDVAKGKVNWIDIGAKVMDSCIDAGVYDPERIRGRGVWIDKDSKGVDRVILHSGDNLLLTREDQPTRSVPFARVRSRWYYLSSRPLLKSDDKTVDYTTQATDEEGLEIREALKLLRWQSPVHADLLAGWVATAIVCGALPWRTHAWVTGNQGSGKSLVVDKLIGAMFGKIAVYGLGATTEAGLRQAIGSDARPIIFDEVEDDKHSDTRRNAIIQLMRQSSSDTRGLILKGGANHEGKAFTIRSSFLLSSIGVGLTEAADLTRTAVLTLKPTDSFSLTEMKENEENFKRIQNCIDNIRPDMPERLLSRQMNNMWALRKNIETFKEIIATSMANRRVGDQLGTLLAGAYSLSSRKVITRRACEKYLEAYDWTDFTSVKTVREDLALLHHICGLILQRVETRNGLQDRAIGEIIYGLLHPQPDPDMYPAKAAETLSRYGLKIDDSKLGIWIGTNVESLKKLMGTSNYANGWQNVLKRNPACKAGDNSMRFRGGVSRAVYLPITEWPIIERTSDDGEN